MPMTQYWDIRGLTHPNRLLLEYTDSSYEEKRYTLGDAPDYDRSQWLNEKFKLLDFPNVGKQKRRRFVWTFWRTRLWILECSLPG
uniref:GST N-terminal domain-containing protein n=1 Tax=Sciurus vulgaris TaxID=55149 RepID=A0A8D2D1V6_SCIVU